MKVLDDNNGEGEGSRMKILLPEVVAKGMIDLVCEDVEFED